MPLLVLRFCALLKQLDFHSTNFSLIVVGPMTVAMLMNNTVQSYLRSVKRTLNTQWSLVTLPLKLIRPVPSDISIARSQEPKDILQLADEIGLLSSEIHLYGPKKAKVSLKTLARLQSNPDGKYVVVAG